VVETVTRISPGRLAVDAHAQDLGNRPDAPQHDTRVERRNPRPLAGARAEEELVVVAAASANRTAPPGSAHRAEPGDSGSSRLATSAPTPLAAQSLPRSPRGPSEMSMQAVAMPREREPSATRACGRLEAREQRIARAALGRQPALQDRSPAAASPGVPLTQRSSPARAPSRMSARPGGTVPAAVTSTGQRPARRVAADERDAVPARERVEAAAKPGSQCSSGEGIVSPSSAQAGSAPIARGPTG
jgi:hypothetical protein